MIIKLGFQQLKHNMYSIFQVVFRRASSSVMLDLTKQVIHNQYQNSFLCKSTAFRNIIQSNVCV